MNILIVGSGAREHTLSWKISQSRRVKKIFVAPGNPGTAQFCTNIAIEVDDIAKLIEFAKKNQIDLTIVGPELPLSLGIVDEFEKQNLRIFGPSKKAALLESSKEFSKKFMKTFNIPTADFCVFDDYKKAQVYLLSCRFPKVLKADGLAQGKGVIVCDNKKQALAGLKKIMKDKQFGCAGNTVVIEECLTGEEVSVICITDSKKAYILPIAQDHKRIGELDTGLNTGGMGVVAPLPKYSNPKFLNKVLETVIYPALQGMQVLGTPFKGALYAGLMVKENSIKVLEFNCRFGDPETQVQLPLVKSDFTKLLMECALGNLKSKIIFQKKFCAAVVLASKGYPSKFQTGFKINLPKHLNSLIFHGGSKIIANKLVTSSGRVLTLVVVNSSLKKALSLAYSDCNKIKFKGKYFRKDIGQKILKHGAKN